MTKLSVLLLLLAAPALAASTSHYTFTGPLSQNPQMRQTIGACPDGSWGCAIDYCVAPIQMTMPVYEQYVVFTGPLIDACQRSTGFCIKAAGSTLATCIDFTGNAQVCLVAQEWKPGKCS